MVKKSVIKLHTRELRKETPDTVKSKSFACDHQGSLWQLYLCDKVTSMSLEHCLCYSMLKRGADSFLSDQTQYCHLDDRTCKKVAYIKATSYTYNQARPTLY